MIRIWIRLGAMAAACAIIAACSTTPKGPVTPKPNPSPGQTTPPGLYQTLYLCPQMTVSNAPPSDDARKVIDFAPQVRVDGVVLIVNPAPGACLSSGFGTRNGKMHKGLDFHASLGAPVIAAADGVVLEAVWRDDFGNMLVVDHGHGVYTRYCHLQVFAEDVTAGSKVKAGEMIALMGNTAKNPVAVHLHYEVLTGDYDTPKKSFGLTAHDPFDYPPA